MNVIISNKNKQILDQLKVEVIKRLDGEYSVEEIIEIFQNFFFNKMFIDITALKNYQDIRTIQKLSISFDMNKIIMLLDPNSEFSTPEYISKLISMGIYNFSTNLEGITYLYSNPNSYRDVAQYHSIDNMILEEPEEIQQETTETPKEENTFTAFEPMNIETNTQANKKRKVIGIKTITNGAGATTLTYLMKKQLEKKYNVLAIELEKRDFIYFNDKTLVSISDRTIGDTLNNNEDKDVILIDLNGSPTAENFCDEILNLLEPSIIKINRLLSIKPRILSELKNRKIILCPSMLTDKDVKDFEYESGLKIYYNLKPVDDHNKSDEIQTLLIKLGFSKLK